jgi:hypothetical protein
MPSILVCVLTGMERTGWISPSLCSSLLRLQRDPRFNITVEMVTDHRPVEYARNTCVWKARAGGNDYLVQIDNDMVLPSNFADILDEVVRTNKAVVSLSSGVLLPEGPQIIPGDNGQKDGRFQETRCAGGGVLIISADVWRVIERGPWFRWVTNDDEVLSRKLGEDYYFCELVQAHGLKVWTHERLAGHLKTADATRLVMQATGPARELEQLRLNIEAEAARRAVQMVKEWKETQCR